MILTDQGLIYAFGFGAHGQLGMGYVKNLSFPETVKIFLKNSEDKAIQISLGQNHSVVLTDSGKVFTTGSS